MLRVEKLCFDFILRFRVQPSKILKLALYYEARPGTMKWATSGYAFEIKVATLLDYSASEGWTLVGILVHFMPIVTRLQRGFVFHLPWPLFHKFLSRLLINACSTINSLECCQGKFFRLCLAFWPNFEPKESSSVTSGTKHCRNVATWEILQNWKQKWNRMANSKQYWPWRSDKSIRGNWVNRVTIEHWITNIQESKTTQFIILGKFLWEESLLNRQGHETYAPWVDYSRKSSVGARFRD